MPTTIHEIIETLSDNGATPFQHGEEFLVYLHPHAGQLMVVQVSLSEEGEYVRFRIPYFLSLEGQEHRAAVMERLLAINYDVKLLKFGVDMQDGEVTAEVNLHIDESRPAAGQFKRAFYILVGPALDYRTRLQTLMQTGVYPASDDPEFCDTLENLLPSEDASEEADEESEEAGENSSLFELFRSATTSDEENGASGGR